MSKAIEQKMGEMPVGKLLVSMAVPMMLSMLVQALYNIVDSVYVAKLGQNALAALSLAFPVQNLMIAVGVGTAIGVNSLVSRKLGEKEYETANKVAGNGIFLAIVSWLLFLVLGLFFCRMYFASFDANETTVQMGADYMSVCMIWSFGIFVALQLERFMQATGRSVFSMITQFTGAVLNIILDPIFIFGYFGVPAMGTKGAAVATVIGQIVGMCMGLFIQFRFIKEIRLTPATLRPAKETIKQIYAVGFPSILMQSIGTVCLIGMNRILISFTEAAVAFYGVFFKLNSFVFMPVFGLNNALIPIVGYNYGARKPERIRKAVFLTSVAAVGIMMIGVVLMLAIPEQLLMIFEASEEMLAIGVPGLRIICVTFLAAAIVITFSSTFQAVGQGVRSLILSALRQMVVILPAAWILGKMFGLQSVWYSFWIADTATLILASIFMAGTLKHFKQLNSQQKEELF